MKEERLSRMLERKRLWEVGFMCKGILDEVMENVARSEMENEVEKMIEEVLGAGMKESMIKKSMSEIQEFNLEGIISLEIRRRKEEEDVAVRILLEEEEKNISLEKKKLKSMATRERYDWLEEGKLAEILARLEIVACIVDDNMEGMEGERPWR